MTPPSPTSSLPASHVAVSAIGFVIRSTGRRVFPVVAIPSFHFQQGTENDGYGENDGDSADKDDNDETNGATEKGGAVMGGRSAGAGQVAIVLRRGVAGHSLRLLEFPAAFATARDGGSFAQAYAQGRQGSIILAFVTFS